MKNIQIILNAILSKNIFEYILIDRELRIVSTSDGIKKYINTIPQKGDDVLSYLPEFVGNEEEIKKIFTKRFCLYSLEAVYKNEFYVNVSVEYCNNDTAIVLLHNITATTLSQQKLLQYSNESTLLYNTLQKVVDNQNALLFVTSNDRIEFANKKFMDYFKATDLGHLQSKKLNLYKKFNPNLKGYRELFNKVDGDEKEIKINSDTFILKATEIESNHKLFTLSKITNISKKVERDSLTGLYRKSYLNNIIKDKIKDKIKFGLVVLDIDNFKQINDKYGHIVGDKVLQEFVHIISNTIRKTDMFARWGGEEFLLLLEDTTQEDALKKVEKIRQSINNHCFNEIEHLSASFGLACVKKDDSLESLITRADTALYEAKADGKNKVIFKKD